jgi:hypothetical protein
MKKIILFCLVVIFSQSTLAKEFYRYKNSDGKIIVKDQVNNEMIAIGYDVLNERGNLLKRVPPGKTLAEEEAERLAEIDAKRDEYKLQQKIRNDAELLRQFSSISDIIRNRDGQLLGLEQRIKIQGSKSDLLKLQLEDQQKQAAIHERLGRKIPSLLQRDINNTQAQIERNEKSTVNLEEEKVEVAKRFENDIVRFRKLESLRMHLKSNQQKDEEQEPIIYDCLTADSCQRAWQLAQVYAKDNASGRIEIITSALILTSRPEKDDDLALSFSKIPGPNNSYQIVLEVTCNDTEKGANFCRSEPIKNLRTNYLTLINKQAE